MSINGVDGKTLEQFVFEVLEVDSMFAAYCKVVDWKEELARLRKIGIPAPLITDLV